MMKFAWYDAEDVGVVAAVEIERMVLRLLMVLSLSRVVLKWRANDVDFGIDYDDEIETMQVHYLQVLIKYDLFQEKQHQVDETSV